ncbi:MAG: hypothetical protein JWL75_338 [Parcubacteria group bacterium]|nr:hypothetical protein [Parcubacteria group bacterium]
MTQITNLANGIINFINNIAVPVIFALAFFFFVFGVFRYLIAGADNEEKRKKGKDIIIYSVIGFAVMMSVWGIINLVVGTFGFSNNNRPCLPTFNDTSNCSNSTGTGSTATTPNGSGLNGLNFVPDGSTPVMCILSSGSPVPTSADDCKKAGGTVKP